MLSFKLSRLKKCEHSRNRDRHGNGHNLDLIGQCQQADQLELGHEAEIRIDGRSEEGEHHAIEGDQIVDEHWADHSHHSGPGGHHLFLGYHCAHGQ